MIPKKSKVYSILRFKCPKCHEGNLFIKKNPYSFKDGFKMHDKCAVCNQDFQIEPGFYIGALWTSFPIVIMIMAALAVLMLVYLKLELITFFIALSLLLFLLQPIIVRLGRAIWIHIFVGYDPSSTGK